MDAEEAADYVQPCSQCLSVDWAVSDEGHFYCKSCHNIIERVREVTDANLTPGLRQRVSRSRRSRKKTREHLHQWVICEGLQFILKAQADALIGLGISSHFKDAVLYQMWKLYLQRSQEAYTHNPVHSQAFLVKGLDTESVTGSCVSSCQDTNSDTDLLSTAGSSGGWSECPSSSDAADAPRRRRTRGKMKTTLALIHLALVWSREALTLSDLLRLVNDGHIPYLNASECLPDEMKSSSSGTIFEAHTVPSHGELHICAQKLARFLQLPLFPPIGQQSLLHPSLLSLRYLLDANLPDELHPCVCGLMQKAGMAEDDFNTFRPMLNPALPRYDVQAAALIVVTMKVVFGMDDHTEWEFSNKAGVDDEMGSTFSVRRWYRLLQTTLIQAKTRQQEAMARKQWRTSPHFSTTRKKHAEMMKKKRVADHVQNCFEKLSVHPVGVESSPPSSFVFCWGEHAGSNGPSMHHMRLHEMAAAHKPTYWHVDLTPCDSRKCHSHFKDVAMTLPKSFVWMLELFSFMLGIEAAYLYEEVLRVERRLIRTRATKVEQCTSSTTSPPLIRRPLRKRKGKKRQ